MAYWKVGKFTGYYGERAGPYAVDWDWLPGSHLISSETKQLENHWTLSYSKSTATGSKKKSTAESEKQAQSLALCCSVCFSPSTAKPNIEPTGKGAMFSGPTSSITNQGNAGEI